MYILNDYSHIVSGHHPPSLFKCIFLEFMFHNVVLLLFMIVLLFLSFQATNTTYGRRNTVPQSSPVTNIASPDLSAVHTRWKRDKDGQLMTRDVGKCLMSGCVSVYMLVAR